MLLTEWRARRRERSADGTVRDRWAGFKMDEQCNNFKDKKERSNCIQSTCYLSQSPSLSGPGSLFRFLCEYFLAQDGHAGTLGRCLRPCCNLPPWILRPNTESTDCKPCLQYEEKISCSSLFPPLPSHLHCHEHRTPSSYMWTQPRSSFGSVLGQEASRSILLFSASGKSFHRHHGRSFSTSDDSEMVAN